MDWFFMQYISNKCALILRESVKNSPIRDWGGLSKMSKKNVQQIMNIQTE